MTGLVAEFCEAREDGIESRAPRFFRVVCSGIGFRSPMRAFNVSRRFHRVAYQSKRPAHRGLRTDALYDVSRGRCRSWCVGDANHVGDASVQHLRGETQIVDFSHSRIVFGPALGVIEEKRNIGST